MTIYILCDLSHSLCSFIFFFSFGPLTETASYYQYIFLSLVWNKPTCFIWTHSYWDKTSSRLLGSWSGPVTVFWLVWEEQYWYVWFLGHKEKERGMLFTLFSFGNKDMMTKIGAAIVPKNGRWILRIIEQQGRRSLVLTTIPISGHVSLIF